jgi:hypothetical protein
MSANARNHQLILINYLSGSVVIFNWSWFSTNQIAVDCTPKAIQLIHPQSERCFWSLDLEFIIPLLSKHQIIQMFYNPMPLHCFLYLVVCRCSHQLRYGLSDPLSDYYSTVSFIFNRLVNSSQIHNAFGKWYPLLFVKHALPPSLSYLFLEFVVYVPKMPRWVEPMLALIDVCTRKFSRVILFWYFAR